LTIEALAGLLMIPALAGAAAGWIYWRAAGRPRTGARENGDDTR
jgi:hypothetical protein